MVHLWQFLQGRFNNKFRQQRTTARKILLWSRIKRNKFCVNLKEEEVVYSDCGLNILNIVVRSFEIHSRWEYSLFHRSVRYLCGKVCQKQIMWVQMRFCETSNWSHLNEILRFQKVFSSFWFCHFVNHLKVILGIICLFWLCLQSWPKIKHKY